MLSWINPAELPWFFHDVRSMLKWNPRVTKTANTASLSCSSFLLVSALRRNSSGNQGWLVEKDLAEGLLVPRFLDSWAWRFCWDLYICVICIICIYIYTYIYISIIYTMWIQILVGGFKPSEKYDESQLG